MIYIHIPYWLFPIRYFPSTLGKIHVCCRVAGSDRAQGSGVVPNTSQHVITYYNFVPNTL